MAEKAANDRAIAGAVRAENPLCQQLGAKGATNTTERSAAAEGYRVTTVAAAAVAAEAMEIEVVVEAVVWAEDC